MEMLAKVRQINELHTKLFAEFLHEDEEHQGGRLEPAGSIADRRTAAASPTATSTRTISCRRCSPGRGGGFVSPGRHIIYQRETPVCNLFATMIERAGVRPEHVGDSTGRLQGLSLS